MELGGLDCFIVREHADIDLAVKLAVQSRGQNAGQVCIAAKRFIVHDSLYDIFVENVVKALKSIRIGDPLDMATELGPLARLDLLEKFQHQLSEAVRQGGKMVFGGGRVLEFKNGNFVYPAVMEVAPDNLAF